MLTYMARLGSFTFGIDTAAFQELQRSSSYRWQSQERIGRKPAQQNTGSGADTITLNGVIYPHYKGGLSQLAAMRAQAASGDPLPLIYAFETAGQYCGLWCITGIEETRTVFFSNGAPRRIEFRLSLVEYGEDESGGLAGQLSAIAAAAGVTSVNASGVAGAASAIAQEAAGVASQSGALAMMGKFASTAKDVASNVSTAVSSVLNSDAVRLARTAVSEVNKLRAQAKALTSAVESVAGIPDNPASALGALGNLAASASTVSDAMSSAASKFGLTADAYNGASTASLYKKQITSAADSFRTLAGAVGSVKTAANTLKGFF